MNLKTPYYIIHEKELDSNFRLLEESLNKHWNNYIIGYSYKTNALPWIIKHFDLLGCYAETVSEDEYNLAKRIGVKNNRIIYNGPIKTRETFIDALSNSCIVNIDSQREIEWLDSIELNKRVIGIRVNFDIEKMCPGQSQCASEGGRFGFCYENGEFAKIVSILRAKKVRIAGLHLHVSSKSRGLEIYRAIAEIACTIKKEYDLDFSYIDVGGGFFGGLPTKPQFDEYMALMESILIKSFDKEKTTLIIEPGMSVIGSPISYVTSVIDVKKTVYNRFVITDGSRTSIDPLMTKVSYFHTYERGTTTGTISKQVICGFTCMEHDRLFVAENEPELNIDDRIIYHKVGAYTMSLTPLFINFFPAVYVEDGESFKLVRKEWSSTEFIQKSIF